MDHCRAIIFWTRIETKVQKEGKYWRDSGKANPGMKMMTWHLKVTFSARGLRDQIPLSEENWLCPRVTSSSTYSLLHGALPCPHCAGLIHLPNASSSPSTAPTALLDSTRISNFPRPKASALRNRSSVWRHTGFHNVA